MYQMRLMLLILLLLTPQLAGAQQECVLPSDVQPISSCIDGSRNVAVGSGACINVFFNSSFTGSDALKTITVESGGKLYVPDGNLEVELEKIEVHGLLQVGSQACPIGTRNPEHQVVLTFQGERPCTSPEQCPDFVKGIQVNAGGKLRLFGVKGVPGSTLHDGSETGISWTHLSAAAGPEDEYGAGSGALVPVPQGGSSTIQLAKDVTEGAGAWQEGDWIAIATTGFSAVETEIVQIDSLQGNVDSEGKKSTTVKLKQSLKHYHFGGADPGPPSLDNYNACDGFNYGVDERAEVGLLSRNIKLTADISDGDNNLHWGGELRFLKGFDEVSIQGVELEKFAKDQLASYPIHFHMAGDVANGPLVNANSIHHSYNKCVTVHSTSSLTVENNVCVRAVGHMYYQEIGDEENISFLNNLGLGVMANLFDVQASSDQEREQKIRDYWWSGDHLGQMDSPDYNGYDGFNLPPTDAQSNPVRGVCAVPTANGLLINQSPFTPEHRNNELNITKQDTCRDDQVYFEPSSGFWIIHPGTTLIGNSIGGCQDVGRGYWYVPPTNRSDAGIPEELRSLSRQPLGEFTNNRVHSCYSGMYAEGEFGVMSEQLFPKVDGNNLNKNIIATFDGLTSTRNRDRGVWLRPMWFVVKNGRFATNRNSVTLVSSGGLDGNSPGIWALLADSVLVGISQNNVDRWGPCPINASESYECIDPTMRAISAPSGSKSFPTPFFNLSGYMIYDGPIRIFRDRFVNFNRDVTLRLTKADQTFLTNFSKYPNSNSPNVYEGDAALGWFQNNQSAYPTGTESRELSWDNVDLRHQIYTEKVNLGEFADGDKNTAIIDLDGTLSGLKVVDSSGNSVEGAHPISLNNLEFNHASNSVDECLAEGDQDTIAEGRPTSLMSAGSYATLEFQALYPAPLSNDPPDFADTKQIVTFIKDQQDFGVHSEMDLTSRDGRGVWEPKVASGYGYTIGASSCAPTPGCAKAEAGAGIPDKISVGLTDAIKPEFSEDDPFYVRVGVCYTNKDGSHPADAFTVTRGYRSWGGGGTDHNDRELQQYFNRLQLRYLGQTCHNLDSQETGNRDDATGCPAAGVTPLPLTGSCPAPSAADTDDQSNPACVYPTSTLAAAASIDDLTDGTGAPDLTKYFYDAARGLLFFYVAQDLPNAFGPSPLGSCTESGSGEDSACPNLDEGESYYACPAAGCADYVVKLGGSYDPGPSNCEAYPTYEQDPPADELLLAHIESNDEVIQVEAGGKDDNFPHYEAETDPVCPQDSLAEVDGDAIESLLLAAKFAEDGTPAPPHCPQTFTAAAGGGCSLQTRASAQSDPLTSLLLVFFLLSLLGSLRIRRS